MSGELKAGVDRPGGRRASLPKDQRSPHSLTTDRPLVFGESPTRASRTTAVRRQIADTVIPLGIVDPEQPQVPGKKGEFLKLGDVRFLGGDIMGYENYKDQEWRRAGGIRPDRYTLTKLVDRPNEAPLYRWSKESPDKPTRHVYLRPLGPGMGWEKVEPKNEHIN